MLNDTVYSNTAIGGAGISGKVAGNAYGGGIDDDTTTKGAGGLSIVNCTVVANSSQSGVAPTGSTAGTGQGGGIANNSLNTNTDAALTVENTLDAGNTASAASAGPDFYGAAATTLDDLIGDGTAASGFSGNGNQVGTTAAPINPLLGPLVDNGGDTDTLALQSGSPAIAAGSLSAANAFGLSTDQRGLPFDSSVSGKVDIGAFDVQATPLPTVTLSPITSTASLGTSLTLTATVSQTSGNTTPTGTVTFLDNVGGITSTLGTATLSSGVATMTVPALPQGSNGITAVYSGDTNFKGNTSAAQTQTVTLASGEAALTASPNVADGLAGSLRAAIATANADTTNSTDVIVLGAGNFDLIGGAIQIDPTKAHTIIIEGQGSSGPNATVISEQTIDRVFQIVAGNSVTFENVEITGGLADTDDTGATTNVSLGGGILDGGNPSTANNSTLTLTGVTVSNNKSVALSNTGIGADGGGVLSTANMVISGSSTIEGNSAIAAVGGTADTADSGNAAGGGVYDLNGGSITQSTIAYNAVLAGAGANGTAGTTGGTGSALNGSTGQAGGQASGGGLYFGTATAANVDVQQNEITGNILVGGAGGTGGAAASGGTDGNGGDGGVSQGAGVYLVLIAGSSGTLTASNNTLTNNTAEAGAAGGIVAADATAGNGGNVFGAGLYAITQTPTAGVTSGIITINSNTISDNTIQASQDSLAEGGGSFLGNGGNSQFEFNSNTVIGNTIGDDTVGGLFGGGLYVANSSTSTASFQVNNDTLENNTLNGKGASTAKGGGAYLDNGGSSPIVFNNGTVSNNLAEVGEDGDASGGGLFATIETAATMSQSGTTSTATVGMDHDTLQDNTAQAIANSGSSPGGWARTR